MSFDKTVAKNEFLFILYVSYFCLNMYLYTTTFRWFMQALPIINHYRIQITDRSAERTRHPNLHAKTRIRQPDVRNLHHRAQITQPAHSAGCGRKAKRALREHARANNEKAVRDPAGWPPVRLRRRRRRPSSARPPSDVSPHPGKHGVTSG